MATPPQPAPESAPQALAVRAQLKRLLAHPLFATSKRYPTLLAYVVEQTLLGKAHDLKERTVAVGAFSRPADYDANADPVVRITAAEVRKRLIQYYYDPSHAGQLVIELPQGSYIPTFREPGATPATASETAAAGPLPRFLGRSRGATLLRYTLVALLAAAAGISIGRYKPTPTPTAFDRFWAPIVNSPAQVTYCIGEPADYLGGQSNPPPAAPIDKDARLVVSDVVTLARTIVPLVPRHGAFRVLPAAETTFAQLREGPVVLIGAFDNEWTLRITEKLRYGFEMHGPLQGVVDRSQPGTPVMRVAGKPTSKNDSTDYALVARIHDKLTGQPVIVVGGIRDKGTEAASEVLYNPAYLEALVAKAPPDWDRRNLIAVIETRLIGGHPGPPSILAVEVW